MGIEVDGIVLSMKNPDTGRYLTANVYTVDGVTEADGVTPRLLSIGQLVMAICLQRAAGIENSIIDKMAEMELASTQLELMTEIESAILAGDVNMSTKKVTYNGTQYTYYKFLSEVMEIDNVPSGTVNADSADLLTAIEAKMDAKNTFSQQAMIELQSLTAKRDQSYDMISNVLKSLNTVLVGIVNNC
jgi:dGTP triphosphohydrolase